MGYNARNDEIRERHARMQGEFEDQRQSLCNRPPLHLGSGVRGAIALITRATPRVAAKIEILSLHIE
jgi:hypothetical protein